MPDLVYLNAIREFYANAGDNAILTEALKGAFVSMEDYSVSKRLNICIIHLAFQ